MEHQNHAWNTQMIIIYEAKKRYHRRKMLKIEIKLYSRDSSLWALTESKLNVFSRAGKSDGIHEFRNCFQVVCTLTTGIKIGFHMWASFPQFHGHRSFPALYLRQKLKQTV